MPELGEPCGSLFNLAALRGPGSFSPRNDGPLITVGALSTSDTPVAVRAGSGFGGAGVDRAAEGGVAGEGITDTGVDDPLAAARSVAAAIGD